MNIYIANLHSAIQDDDLRTLFERYGEVSSAKIINDRETGESRGFGFVEMPNDEEAKNAIETLNGATWEEKELVVKEARPREDKGGFRGGNNRSFGGGGNRGGGGGGFKPRSFGGGDRGGFDPNRKRFDRRYFVVFVNLLGFSKKWED